MASAAGNSEGRGVAVREASRMQCMRACQVAFLALVTIAGLASCQEKTHSPIVTINIVGDRGAQSFNPSNITVDYGTVVTWVNHDSQPHSVTAPGAFNSGMIAPNGGRWSWVAAMAGTFAYSSITSPTMNGTITVIVQPPQPPPATQ